MMNHNNLAISNIVRPAHAAATNTSSGQPASNLAHRIIAIVPNTSVFLPHQIQASAPLLTTPSPDTEAFFLPTSAYEVPSFLTPSYDLYDAPPTYDQCNPVPSNFTETSEANAMHFLPTEKKPQKTSMHNEAARESLNKWPHASNKDCLLIIDTINRAIPFNSIDELLPNLNTPNKEGYRLLELVSSKKSIALNVRVKIINELIRLDKNKIDKTDKGILLINGADTNSSADVVHASNDDQRLDTPKKSTIREPIIPSHKAILNGDLEIFEALAQHPDFDPNQDSHGNTPLIIATQLNSAKSIQKVLEAGANINWLSARKTGHSALHIAVNDECFHAIDALLNNPKCDPNIMDANGHTPLQYALIGDCNRSIEKLLKHSNINVHVCTEVDTVFQLSTLARTPLTQKHLEVFGASRKITALEILAATHSKKSSVTPIYRHYNKQDQQGARNSAKEVAIRTVAHVKTSATYNKSWGDNTAMKERKMQLKKEALENLDDLLNLLKRT